VLHAYPMEFSLNLYYLSTLIFDEPKLKVKSEGILQLASHPAVTWTTLMSNKAHRVGWETNRPPAAPFPVTQRSYRAKIDCDRQKT
jgi:hypothetical protein